MYIRFFSDLVYNGAKILAGMDEASSKDFFDTVQPFLKLSEVR